MPNSPQVIFKDKNLTDTVSTPLNGINFVSGKSLRGPFNKPDQIFTSWPAFIRTHGGMIDDDTSIKLKRLFEKGGKVRFSRLGHYTTIATRSTLTALKAITEDEVVDAEDNVLFELPLKYEGADYNNIKVIISAGSNGITGYFNIDITHALEPDLNERYTNLSITSSEPAGTYDFLKAIVDGSSLVDVKYKDLTLVELTNGFIMPILGTLEYAGGTDGGALVSGDMIGDSASNTGFYAFDDYNDSFQVMVALTDVPDAVHIAGAAYADNRKDLMYWGFLENVLSTKANLKAKIASLGIDSKLTAFFAGGLNVLNPVNSQTQQLEAITDIAALANNSDTNFGVHYSFAGKRRGIITNQQGVVNNFGSPAKAADLNDLANSRLNMIINRDGQTFLSGNFTQQVKLNQESYINVVRGVLAIKKALRPLLDNYLEEPNDMTSWKDMYYAAKPYMDSLITNRALFSYEWLGDQFVTKLADVQINTPADVTAGKYKIKLMLSFIPSMQEIEVTLVLTPGNISFEIAGELA